MTEHRLSRRAALKAAAAGAAVTAGCGNETPADPAVGPDPTSTTTTAPGDRPPAPPSPPAPPAPEPPALTPKQLLAGIDHIVVVMMENRSFDHFLGALKGDAAYASRATVDGLTGTETNPAPDGSPVGVFKMDNFTPKDPPHGWDASRVQFAGGKNDGFVKAHAGDTQHEAMGYHDRSQIPFYYWLADNFAICDRWFASVMGPTWPNRFYLNAATSRGKKDNTPILVNVPPTIWDRLEAKGLTFKNYAAGATTWYVGGFAAKVLSLNPSAPIGEFFDAARDGTLPSFSMIDPDYLASDDHPSHDIQRGQAFVASVYKALAAGPRWSKTLLVVTYDEHCGFFDHVPPPKTVDDDLEFEQLGFRVPAFVIGPTVKKGYVCKKQLEHVSVAATLRTRWDIASLNKRMDATNDVTDCIDPAKVNAPAKPPPGMPAIAMSMTMALEDNVGPHSQPVLEDLVARGVVPVVDTRSDRARIADWLSRAVEVGAVRLVG